MILSMVTYLFVPIQHYSVFTLNMIFFGGEEEIHTFMWQGHTELFKSVSKGI